MAWYKKNADPDFLYLQEMARVLGLEAMRMADADVLPYDYVAYAREISAYIEAAKRKAADAGPSTGRNRPNTTSALSTLPPPKPPRRASPPPPSASTRFKPLHTAISSAESRPPPG